MQTETSTNIEKKKKKKKVSKPNLTETNSLVTQENLK